MAEPFVSICIPARNGARELPLTLTNLLRQSDHPVDRLEIIVADHGSNDATADLIADFARRFQQIRRVFVEYTGPNRSRARNAAMNAARGEILVLIDHDVLPSTRMVSGHLELHRHFSNALVAGMTFGRGTTAEGWGVLPPGVQLERIGDCYDELSGCAELADVRLSSGALNGADPQQDVTDTVAPQRLFYSCNLSIPRQVVERIGGFDENFAGWGLEDDEFALRCRAQGRLVFSRRPWALHLPHPTDALANLAQWRQNYDYLFHKHATRELEYYSHFGGEVEAGARRMEAMVRRLAQWAPEGLKPPNVSNRAGGRRLAHFPPSLQFAKALGATDVLCPTMSLTAYPVKADGMWQYPLFGTRTPFRESEFDEAVLIADRVMLLERQTLLCLVSEMARVARSLWLLVGPLARKQSLAPMKATLDSVLSQLGRSPKMEFVEL